MKVDYLGERVSAARDGAYAEVVLRRPNRHNAVDVSMRDELVQVLRALRDESTVDAIGLLGDGPSFCSGGDLHEFGSTDPVTAHIVRTSRSLAAVVADVAPRLVVGVHGSCIGAGVEIAAFGRRVVAHADTVFSLPEVRMGLLPGMGGTVSIPARIGRGRTLWLLLTGERVDAATAAAWGLVDEVSDAHVADRVRLLARGVAA